MMIFFCNFLDDIKHLVNIARPKLLFVEQNVLEVFEDVIQELELNTKIVILDPEHSKNQHISFSQFLEAEFESFEIAKCADPKDQIAFLMSSSGTTGLPKVVSLTHANLIFQLKQNDKPFPPFLTILNMSSLFWISGVMVTLGGISAGIIRLLSPPFDPEFTLQTIEKYKAFWIILGVTYFARMVTCENINKYNLTSVRMITIGGGKASKQHLEIGKEKFANVQLHPAYGLTETAGAALQLNDAKPNSIGYLIPGIEAKVSKTMSTHIGSITTAISDFPKNGPLVPPSSRCRVRKANFTYQLQPPPLLHTHSTNTPLDEPCRISSDIL